jgi:hypothetical protein
MQVVHLLGADIYWVALVLLGAETIWPATETSTSPISADVPASATLA